jgi:hypothetical protein
MMPSSITATRLGSVRRSSRIRGAVGWVSSAALRIGGGGEEDRGQRGEGAEVGGAREAFAASGGTCPRRTVSINACRSIA